MGDDHLRTGRLWFQTVRPHWFARRCARATAVAISLLSMVVIATLSGAAATGSPAAVHAAQAPATMMTVDDFVRTYDGDSIDLDGGGAPGNPYQCVDLANLYHRKVVGGDGHWIRGNGQDWWTSSDPEMGLYTKVSSSSPGRKGDLAVWSGTDGFGHIAVVLADNGATLSTFTQTQAPRTDRTSPRTTRGAA